MKKLVSVIVFTLAIFLAVAQKDTAKTIQVFANHLSMAIPADVNEMTADMIQIKYHKAKDENTNFYGDEDASFSIVSSVVMPNNVREEDMVAHKEELLSAIKAKYKLLTDEVRTVNKHKLIVISFFSDIPGGKVLNKRFFAVVNQKIIMVTFNATEAELKKREPQIETSINSVVIK